MPIVFIFLDGLGLAPAGPFNPLSTSHTPYLRELLGGPLCSESVQSGSRLLLRPVDAALGVEGLPQSGTGHVALLVGVNAPALHGRHQPNFPPVALRPLLTERSIFMRARASGYGVTFANVFTDAYWQALANRRMRKAASVFAAEGAGLKFRDLDDMRAGKALSWDITGAAIQTGAEEEDRFLPISPRQAGINLAGLAYEHDLVFFECYLPDLAGHGRLGPDATGEVLERIDGLIGSTLAALPANTTLLICSDHGNIEDTTTRVHTLNPVPLLLVGPAAAQFAAVERIDQLADVILRSLA